MKDTDFSAMGIDLDGPITVPKSNTEMALDWFSVMVKIRHVERLIAQGREAGEIGGPVHLGSGQEAVAVGVCAHIGSADGVFGAHRSHSHVISLGTRPRDLFAEVLGARAGLSGGRGGSMHLVDPSNQFLGSVPIVAGTVPLAVGAALAFKNSGSAGVAVVFLGDGAVEEGVVHESLNLATMLEVPVLFVVENNLFSSHLHISERQPFRSVSRFGSVHNVDSVLVDGNNVLDVFESAKSLINSMRIDGRPRLLEAITFRHFGHVDWRDDIDVGINRSEADLKLWKSRDPISRLHKALNENNGVSIEQLDSLKASVIKEVEDEWRDARLSPKVTDSTLLDHVYKETL